MSAAGGGHGSGGGGGHGAAAAGRPTPIRLERPAVAGSVGAVHGDTNAPDLPRERLERLESPETTMLRSQLAAISSHMEIQNQRSTTVVDAVLARGEHIDQLTRGHRELAGEFRSFRAEVIGRLASQTVALTRVEELLQELVNAASATSATNATKASKLPGSTSQIGE